MTGIKLTALGPAEVEIVGELSGEVFATWRAAALNRLNQSVKLDGFRPGHIPEKILVEKLGEETILTEMAEMALREHYPKILSEHKIEAIGRPEITITKIGKDNFTPTGTSGPLGFKIKTALAPTVKLPDYQKLAKKINAEPVEQKDKRRLQLMDEIIKPAEIVLPNILIESEIDQMLSELRGQIERLGLKFEEYLKHLKKEEPDLRQDWRADALKRAQTALVLSHIAAAEKIGAEVEETEHEVKHLREHYPQAAEGRLRAYVVNAIITEKVWRFLENQK